MPNTSTLYEGYDILDHAGTLLVQFNYSAEGKQLALADMNDPNNGPIYSLETLESRMDALRRDYADEGLDPEDDPDYVLFDQAYAELIANTA